MLLTAHYICAQMLLTQCLTTYFSWSSYQSSEQLTFLCPLCPYLCLMLANALFRNVFLVQQYYGLLQRRSGKDIHSWSRWRRGIRSYRRKIINEPSVTWFLKLPEDGRYFLQETPIERKFSIFQHIVTYSLFIICSTMCFITVFACITWSYLIMLNNALYSSLFLNRQHLWLLQRLPRKDHHPRHGRRRGVPSHRCKIR